MEWKALLLLFLPHLRVFSLPALTASSFHSQPCSSLPAPLACAQTNTRVAAALGNGYAVQLGTVFLDALNLYKAYNGIVAEAVAAGGLKALHSTDVRQMRAIKREILRLVEAFIEHSEDTQVRAAHRALLPSHTIFAFG